MQSLSGLLICGLVVVVASLGNNLQMAKIMEDAGRIANQRSNNLLSWSRFSNFVGRYEKSYSSKSEALRRFNTYKSNMDLVKKMQKKNIGTAVFGETQFMDMTPEEFQRIYLPYTWEHNFRITKLDPNSTVFDLEDPLPESLDWREKGAVTVVKNQEACGSCWAFSVTGNIESQWAIKTKKLISLSEQELLDCDVVDQACNGGMPPNTYDEIIRLGGLETESSYPYDAAKEQCQLERSEFAVYINDSVQMPEDEEKMAIWLFKNGPLSVGMNAETMMTYKDGILNFSKDDCSPKTLTHGVLIVGYGTENDIPFWIIKNSWGPNWGESGYLRLYRGNNVCGINRLATTAIIN